MRIAISGQPPELVEGTEGLETQGLFSIEDHLPRSDPSRPEEGVARQKPVLGDAEPLPTR